MGSAPACPFGYPDLSAYELIYCTRNKNGAMWHKSVTGLHPGGHIYTMSAEEVHEDELESLPDRPVEAPKAKLVVVDQIQPLQNVRSVLGDVAGLAENIRVRGLLHPVVLRPSIDPSHGKPYELIVGYRRLEAFRSLGRAEIPAVIHNASDQEVLAEVISENLQRENHSPMDEARTMQRMIETFDWSHAQVAQQLGVDRSQVTKRLGLLKLPEKVQTMVDEKKLSASHAEVVARLDTPEQQEELADLAVRLDAPVAKLNSYASKMKAQQQEEELSDIQPPDQDDPLEEPEVVVLQPTDLPHLEVGDLTGAQASRAGLFVLLRSANDLEMLQYLEAECGTNWDQLWEWTGLLSEEQVDQMTKTMIRRWLGAAHRFPTLPLSLQDELGGAGEPLSMPEDLPDMGVGPEDDWDEDWDEEDPF